MKKVIRVADNGELNKGGKKIMSESKIIMEKGKKIGAGAIIALSLVSGLGGGIGSYLFLSNDSNGGTTNSLKSNVKYEIKSVDNPVIAISKKVNPSVVGINVKSVTVGMMGLEESGGEGSGVVYSEDGYIITNYHVVESAIGNSSATIEVTLPNESAEVCKATIVGGDKVTDLAVLKIEKTGLTKAEFGDSSKLNVGETAVAIGNPLGQDLAGSVTSGVISALNRKIVTDGRTYKLVQTDAAINSGNSGGALANSKGEVIGINTVKVIATGVEGIGFAIPSNDVKPIVEELIKNKKIARPYIGIYGIDVDKDTASRYSISEGIYIQQVITGSPAEKAGLKKADVIISANGKDIQTMDQLNVLKNACKIGDKFKLKVVRQSKEVEITVVLAEETTNE